MEMLTLEEVLSDAASSPGFGHLKHVDIADNEGNTALHEAVIWYHTSADYELIKMEANQNLKIIMI